MWHELNGRWGTARSAFTCRGRRWRSGTVLVDCPRRDLAHYGFDDDGPICVIERRCSGSEGSHALEHERVLVERVVPFRGWRDIVVGRHVGRAEVVAVHREV